MFLNLDQTGQIPGQIENRRTIESSHCKPIDKVPIALVADDYCIKSVSEILTALTNVDEGSIDLIHFFVFSFAIFHFVGRIF